MTHGHNLIRNPVRFVSASRKPADQCGWNGDKSSELFEPKLNGSEAKNFYETVLKTPSTSQNRNVRTKQPALTRKVQRSKDIKPSAGDLNRSSSSIVGNNVKLPTTGALFKAAEGGILNDVKRIVESRIIDINAVDQYSWTSLMMAASNGHEEVVKYLLSQGAEWEDYVDGGGYDAFNLACMNGHPHIAHLLRHWKVISKQEARRSAIKQARSKIKREKLWCPVCKVQYSATSDGNEEDNDHNRSISHQFCSRSNNNTTSTQSYFYLSSSNKGYRMLESSGWDGNSGLGPTSSGRKYPIKTVLKRDRFGIGCQARKAKVTHFASLDSSAILQPKRAKLKRLDADREKKEKKLAIDFRRSFY